MRMTVYVNDECVYEQSAVDPEKLNELQKILLQNPLIINLIDVGYVPKINSLWDGKNFSEIDIENYSNLIQGTTNEYFAVVLNNKVERILIYSEEYYNAIMSSNPVFKLEGDKGAPVTMETI